MVEKDFATVTLKYLVLPAAIIGGVQAAVWLGLSLTAILYHTVITVHVPQLSYNYGDIIYELYLDRDQTQTSNEFIIYPKSFNIIMYIYVVLSFAWLIISLILIWMTVRKKWRNVSIIVIVWSSVTIVTAILDIITMSLLAADLYKAHQTLRITSNAIVTPQSIYTSMGIIMSTAARGYVLWIINVVFAIVLLVAVIKSNKQTRPSMLRPVINAFERGPKPFSMYDQVEIDKSFQNPAYQHSTENIFSPRGTEQMNGKNPLSNSNRSSLAPSQASSYPYERTNPLVIPPVQNRVAKIGKAGGRRSPPRSVPSPTIPHMTPNVPMGMPYIPEPDYTPPSSPTFQPKSVLRPRSNYEL